MNRIESVNANYADQVFARLAQLFNKSGDGYEFTREAFLELSEPSVYVIVDKSGAVLYVGQSVQGFRRITDPQHCTRAKWLAEMATVRVYPCRTKQTAIEAEALLIHLFKPTYNTINPRSRLRTLLDKITRSFASTSQSA